MTNNEKVQKNIHLTDEVISGLKDLSLKEDRTLKAFIERELIAMAAKGVSYLDLYTQYERTAQKLREILE